MAMDSLGIFIEFAGFLPNVDRGGAGQLKKDCRPLLFGPDR
jgi:hypothetical protein